MSPPVVGLLITHLPLLILSKTQQLTKSSLRTSFITHPSRIISSPETQKKQFTELLNQHQNQQLSSAKLLHNHGKSPCFMAKSTISMAIFQQSVSLPEGKPPFSYGFPMVFPFKMVIFYRFPLAISQVVLLLESALGLPLSGGHNKSSDWKGLSMAIFFSWGMGQKTKMIYPNYIYIIIYINNSYHRIQ